MNSGQIALLLTHSGKSGLKIQSYRQFSKHRRRTCAVREENDKRIQMELGAHMLLAFDLRIEHLVFGQRQVNSLLELIEAEDKLGGRFLIYFYAFICT